MNRPVSALPPRRLANSTQRRPLISLTPLIDVVFILLVFFMLASSFLDWRAIDLNAPAQTAAGSSVEGALLVEVGSEDLRLSGETMSLETLAARVAERVAVNPEQKVLVKPASGVPLQGAVEILDGLTSAGVIDLSLIRGARR